MDIVIYETETYQIVRCATPREVIKDTQGVPQEVNFKCINKQQGTVEGKFVQYPVAVDTCNYLTRLLEVSLAGHPEPITEIVNASIN